MSAQGSLQGAGQAFQDLFIAEDRQILASGSFNPPLVQYGAPNLTHTYGNLAELSGNYQVYPGPSHGGPTDVNITAEDDNGNTVSLHGVLVPPAPSREQVSGFIRFSLDQ